jgi:hypothetical protein
MIQDGQVSMGEQLSAEGFKSEPYEPDDMLVRPSFFYTSLNFINAFKEI